MSTTLSLNLTIIVLESLVSWRDEEQDPLLLGFTSIKNTSLAVETTTPNPSLSGTLHILKGTSFLTF